MNTGLGFYSENGIPFQKEGKHIAENIKRILSTRRGERIGNLSFGSDVSKYIFMPEMSIDDLISEIQRAIVANEPRVIINEITLQGYKTDTVSIFLNLTIKETGENLKVQTEI
jgi:phage baseplate assembly protein W